MLTDMQIKKLRHDGSSGGRRVIWDTSPHGHGALGIRLGARAKAFVFKYSWRGKTKWLTLGRYPEVSLQSARALAAAAAAKIEKGEDPGTRYESPTARRNAATVSDLVEGYLERWARPRKRSWREDERILRKHVTPKWGDMPARDLHRRDVNRMLEAIAKTAPTQANRTLAALRKAFNWAIQVELVESNPCWQIPAPSREHPRDRVLTDDEIRAVWAALGRSADDGLTPALPDVWPSLPVRLGLKLALVTAQRMGEIAGAALSEFDLVHGWWTIPADRAKNGLAHRVPLSRLAIEIIEQIQASTGAGSETWLLPSRRQKGRQPVRSAALSRAVHQIRQIAGVDDWRGHDLRRTAASGMASAGVTRLVIGQVLNHAEQGVTAVYDRHSYDLEKRSALDIWTSRLRRLTSGTSDHRS